MEDRSTYRLLAVSPANRLRQMYHVLYASFPCLVLRYDLVDLTRQALAKHANQLFLQMIEDYQLKDAYEVASKSQ